MKATTTRRKVLKGLAVLALMGAVPLFGVPAWAKGKGGGKGEEVRRNVAEDPKERSMTEEELQQRKEEREQRQLDEAGEREQLREQAEEQKELRKGRTKEIEDGVGDDAPEKIKEMKKNKKK
jgi:hypothetical protein